jgi:hypothetical protein
VAAGPADLCRASGSPLVGDEEESDPIHGPSSSSSGCVTRVVHLGSERTGQTTNVRTGTCCPVINLRGNKTEIWVGSVCRVSYTIGLTTVCDGCDVVARAPISTHFFGWCWSVAA